MKFYSLKTWLIISVLSLSQATKLAATETISLNTHALTSKQLVIDVLLANPQLEVAEAIWEAAKARIAQQSDFEDPVFSYTMAPQTIGKQQAKYGQRIEISQQLPWPGKQHLRSQTASHKANVSRQNINSLRLKLSAATQALFADWHYSHQAIHINQRNQSLLKEFKAIAISRYSTGLASKQDALRADMELALLEHQAIVLARQQNAIRTHINTLLNKPPNHALAPPASLTEIETLTDIKSLQIRALQARPELKALTATIAAAKSQSELAFKNNYPDINLKAGYNSLWENSSKHFTVGIGFKLPLFQDKYRAAENEALAQVKQVEWQRIDFMAKLKEEIQISHDWMTESMHVLNLYKNKLLPLAKETLDAAISDYQSGKGDFLSLISSEKNYMRILLQSEQALADTHRQLAKLTSAVGHLKPPFASKPQISEAQ